MFNVKLTTAQYMILTSQLSEIAFTIETAFWFIGLRKILIYLTSEVYDFDKTKSTLYEIVFH